MNKEMTEEAKEARRTYKREWAARNRDKVREYNQRHWEKKAGNFQDFYREDTRTADAFAGKDLKFTIYECVEPGDGFEKGCLYAGVGTNNGIQIVRENSNKDTQIFLFQSAGFPAESWEGTGKPAFRLFVKGGKR